MKGIKGERNKFEVSVDNIREDVINVAEIIKDGPQGTKLKFQLSEDKEKLKVEYNNPAADQQLRFAFDDMDTDTIIVEAAEDQPAITYGHVIQAIDDTLPVWVMADPVIFDQDAQQVFLGLSQEERPRFVTDMIDRFYAKRPEYGEFAKVTVYKDPAQLLDFLKSLSLEDFIKCKLNKPEERFLELGKRIGQVDAVIEQTPLNPEKLATVWPVLALRESFLESELSALYYLKFPRISTKEKAREQGALMTTGGRLADISNKDYSGWLDEIPNNAAYISYVGPHYWDNIEVDEGGNIYDEDEAKVQRAIRSQDEKIVKAFENGSFGSERPAEHERINKEVLRALLNATIEEHGAYKTIYLPTFAAELNKNYKIDVDEYETPGELNDKGRQERAAADQRAKDAEAARKNGEKVYTNENPSIMQQFYNLDYWVGVIDGSFPKRTAIITGLNKEAKTIEVVLPYIDAIKSRVQEAQRLEAETHRRAYMLPAYNFLVHTSIESERNKLAVDLVYTIIDKLLQRGSKPASEFKENQAGEPGAEEPKPKAGERVTYRIKYKTLIDDTPLFYMEYKKATTADQKYKLLTRTFKRAFQLLHKKTDIYDYFIDLKIPETPPTIRTIDNTFVITHKGKNSDYKIKKIATF